MSNQKAQVTSRTQIDRNEFWQIVNDCLVAFHKLTPQKAQNRTRRLRVRIESAPRSTPTVIFYHSEPFDVACDLAERQLDFIKFRRQYECLLKRHGW
jgi:hypothetical protein